jgi:DNA gyrase subunit A
MGKRSRVDAYRLQQRGGKGVINVKVSEKTGEVVTIKSVVDEDELMLITRNGVVNRQRVEEIRVIGRATQGVRLVSLDEDDHVMDVARVMWDDKAHERAPRANGWMEETAEPAGRADAGEEAGVPTEGEA